VRSFQLWLPTVGYSLTTSIGDRERAFSIWRGESRIWLLPGVKSPVRWRDKRSWWSWQVAVPAENLDCLDIFYVRGDGLVAGFNAEKRFPDSSVSNLLKNWFNVEWVCPVGDSLDIRFPVTLQMPQFDGRGVTWTEVVISYEAALTLPSRADEWLSPILDDGRSAIPQFHSPRTPNRQHTDHGGEAPEYLEAIFRCPQQLAPLVPGRDFRHILWAQEQMTEIIQNSKTDELGALRKASTAAMPYLSVGCLPRELEWLCPLYPTIWGKTEEEDSTRFKSLYPKAQSHFDLRHDTLDDSLRSGEWENVMGQLIPIRRAWGIVGLLWTLFLEKLSRNELQACLRCDRILEGTRARKYCGEDDDEACYRRRRADDQYYSRVRRSQKEKDR